MKIRNIVIASAAIVLVGCSSGPTNVTTTTGSSSDSTAVADSLPPTSDGPTTTDATIANPASVFCVEQGGTVEIVDEAAGQVGYCILPDGTRIEEWEYYRSENPDASEGDGESGLPGEGVE